MNDLQLIENYSTEQWGLTTARRYMEDMEAGLDRLRVHPDLLVFDAEISPDLGFLQVNKHVLICTHTIDKVIVLTVLHTSMDLPTRLFELEPQLKMEAVILRQSLKDR